MRASRARRLESSQTEEPSCEPAAAGTRTSATTIASRLMGDPSERILTIYLQGHCEIEPPPSRREHLQGSIRDDCSGGYGPPEPEIPDVGIPVQVHEIESGTTACAFDPAAGVDSVERRERVFRAPAEEFEDQPLVERVRQQTDEPAYPGHIVRTADGVSDEMPARTQDPSYFVEKRLWCRDVLQHHDGGDHIKGSVGKWDRAVRQQPAKPLCVMKAAVGVEVRSPHLALRRSISRQAPVDAAPKVERGAGFRKAARQLRVQALHVAAIRRKQTFE